MKLEISNLDFGYSKDNAVLNDVTLSVETGSSIAFVGPSGSGKTTLLRITAGVLNRDNQHYLKGQISWDAAKDTTALRRSGKIGYVFQVPNLLPHLTVAQNVMFPFTSAGLSKKRHSDDAMELLRKVGLAQFRDYFPDQLSVGMRARVALARTFATDPSLLLLDEPFSALDVGWRLTLYNQLWMNRCM